MSKRMGFVLVVLVLGMYQPGTASTAGPGSFTAGAAASRITHSFRVEFRRATRSRLSLRIAMSSPRPPTVHSHFVDCAPSVRAVYDAILKAARALGTVKEDPKKTSIHLTRSTAFAGVATRRNGLTLTLKSPHAAKNARIHKQEQTSANRWHLEIKLTDPREVDDELRGWLAVAYDLS